jgi:hypothetical protein
VFDNLKQKTGLWAIVVVLIMAHLPQARAASRQPLKAEMEDGVVLKVHLPADLPEGDDYPQQVLQAACTAYKEIVFHQGFNRQGYTFSSAEELFAYDSDKTIDIYICAVQAPMAWMEFAGDLQYQGKVLIPQDYEAYRQRYNIDQPQVELEASLIHELCHIIVFSYNRNMQTLTQGKTSLTSKRWDWYNEGLARYFETLVGYEDEFLSAGYRRDYGIKTVVYKGGVNYFLKYPDRPLEKRKYDFALFWQYVHRNYGMDKIEQISCEFRKLDPLRCTNYEAMQVIARTLGLPLKELLRDFSLYIYRNSCLPEHQENKLHPVYTSKLSQAVNPPKNINSFGFDFYEIDLPQPPKEVRLKVLGPEQDPDCLVAGYVTQEGKMIMMLANPTDEIISYQVLFY